MEVGFEQGERLIGHSPSCGIKRTSGASGHSGQLVNICCGAEDRMLGRQTRLLFLGRELPGPDSGWHSVGAWQILHQGRHRKNESNKEGHPT